MRILPDTKSTPFGERIIGMKITYYIPDVSKDPVLIEAGIYLPHYMVREKGAISGHKTWVDE